MQPKSEICQWVFLGAAILVGLAAYLLHGSF